MDVSQQDGGCGALDHRHFDGNSIDALAVPVYIRKPIFPTKWRNLQKIQRAVRRFGKFHAVVWDHEPLRFRAQGDHIYQLIGRIDR